MHDPSPVIDPQPAWSAALVPQAPESASGRLASRRPRSLHRRVRRAPEPDALVELVRVARMEQPALGGVGTQLDHLAHEFGAQALATVLGQHVHVSEVDERRVVSDGTRKPDLASGVVEAHHTCSLTDQSLDGRSCPAPGPVGLLCEEAVHGVHVDPVRVVIQLEGIAEIASHPPEIVCNSKWTPLPRQAK